MARRQPVVPRSLADALANAGDDTSPEDRRVSFTSELEGGDVGPAREQQTRQPLSDPRTIPSTQATVTSAAASPHSSYAQQGSFPSSAGSLAMSVSPTSSEPFAAAPPASQGPLLGAQQRWDEQVGLLRPRFGAYPSDALPPQEALPLRTTSVPAAAIRAAAVQAEAAAQAVAARPSGLPPRYHRRTQSIGGGGDRHPATTALPTPSLHSAMPSTPGRSSGPPSSGKTGKRRERPPSATEAALQAEAQGRLLRGQSIITKDTDIPEDLREAAASAVRRTSPATAQPRQAPLRTVSGAAAAAAQVARGSDVGVPAGLPRVLLHAATRSSGPPSSRGDNSAAASPRVIEHCVAGDLIVAEGKPSSRPSAPSSEVLRQATKRNVSVSVDKDPRKETKQDVRYDSESDILEEGDLKDEEEAEEAKGRWWSNRWVHGLFIWAPIILTACLIVAGIILVIFFKGRYALYFDAWRWCFLFAAFVPIYWLSRLIVHLLVLMVERKLFTSAKVLYFMTSVRKSLARMLRMALWIPVYAALFGPVSSRSHAVHDLYYIFLRLLACATLFWFAMVVKTIIARTVASHFHKEALFEKMKRALEKEQYLSALSQPRQEDRVDDLLLGQTASRDGSQAVADLNPEQLQLLKFERDVSKQNIAVGIVKSVLRPGRRRSSSGNLSALERAQTAPDPLPEARAPTLRRTTAIPEEEGTVHGSSPPKTPKASHGSSRGGSVPGTPQQKPSDSPARSLKRVLTGNRPSASPGSPPLQSIKVGKGKGEKPTPRSERPSKSGEKGDKGKKEDEGLATTISLPGNTSSELDIVMKLHKVERHIRKNKLKVTLTEQIGDTSAKELSSKAEARRLAFYLFWNIKPYFDRNYIIQDDLEHFLPAKKAAKAFEMLDVDGDGKVTLHNIRDAVITVYQERKHLAATLKDTKTVVGRLELLIGVTTHLLFIFFYLLIFRVNVNKVWLTVSSVLLALSFVFGNSIRNVFESVVFLFVVHPFDVGDALLVIDPQNSSAGPQYSVVEEIMLLNTKVKRWDGAMVYFPNAVLNSNPLINLSRSDNKWEFFKMFLDIGTPGSVFEELKRRIKAHLEETPREFTGEFSAMNISSGDPMKIQLGVFFEYTHNGVDQGRTNRARHGLYVVICKTLTELGAMYTMPAFSHDKRGQGDNAGAAQQAMAAGGAGMLGAAAATRPYKFY